MQRKKHQERGLNLGRTWAISMASMAELRTIVEDSVDGQLGDMGTFMLEHGLTRMSHYLDNIDDIDTDEFRTGFFAGVLNAIDEFVGFWPGYEQFAAA